MSGTWFTFIEAAKRVTLFAVITGAFLVIAEGLGSTAIAVYQALQKPSSSAPSRYDRSVGWVGMPDTYIPDMYGSGRYVRTNRRGFREDDETEVMVPYGKLRIICSGNSFTYGEGVANDRTWCRRISELMDRFETVNMGQVGYGVDQMFLWYARDGVVLDHSIHIFAFVGGDLDRMAFRSRYGYGKPVLKFEDGELVSDNVPVPRLRWWVSRVVGRADLRSVDFARRILGRLFPPRVEAPATIDVVAPVASKVFETVQRLSDEKNIVPVFVFLPTERDLEGDTAWRLWVEATMDSLDLEFVDLTPALRRVPAGRAASFFIPQSMPAGGHYTEAGNDWVAEVLRSYVMAIPRVRTLLAATPSPHSENGR